ncbi:MAG: hypothetical protein U0556_13125 [Dehalococcoidia bacterium]
MASSIPRRLAGWITLSAAGALALFGLTSGSAHPLAQAASPGGSYPGPNPPYGPASRVALPVGLKNASLTGPSNGYQAPAPKVTPSPPPPVPRTTTPAPTVNPYGGPR